LHAIASGTVGKPFFVHRSQWTDMTAERKEHATGSSGVLDAEVTRLAAKAISVLIGERGVKRPTIEARLELLGDAFLSDRCDTHRAIVGRMRKEGVSVTDIIDVVLPAVARNAGQRWMDDEISFADVTVVTARLQETVRAFGRVPRGQCPANAPGNPQFARPQPRVLLIIPRTEEHTFGAIVVADQMRRLGLEVDIAMDLHPGQIGAKVRKTRYNMVGISASGRRSLASARELVKTIKASVTRVTPVVLGGSVVGGGADLQAMTGVDHVLSDVPSALRACGIMTEDEDAVHNAP
jgi:methylmalonyl-CoA mutase cobalamin-binding subunit